MIELPAPDQINGDALTEELQAAGLPVPIDGVSLQPDTSTVRLLGLDETHQVLATAVLAVHAGEPTAEQQERLEADAESRDMEDRARQLVTKARAVLNGTDTFTQDQAQRALAAVIIYLARRYS